MNNRKTGNSFEAEFCDLLFQHGYWVHNLAQNAAGQPADVIAVKTMKFKKFVKSLGADGILYVRENGDRWLSSGSIFMKVPEDIRTVTACDSASMLASHVVGI